MITSNDLRRKFFKFFKEKGHSIVDSSSLIPHNDPSLLFNSAGMVPFKDMFLGKVKLEYTRAVSIQKCVRTTDIDNIGVTSRHHTFFEMMGNFSFGDYFKKEAIEWAWEFLTGELGLPKNKLSATIYQDDDEAFNIWLPIIGVDNIYRLGADSNFWMIGDTGPSGPCSEILFDKGKEFACDDPNCAPGCDCDRYLEVWNLVFTELERKQDGSFSPLPKKNIDTGMGFERLLSIVQDVESGYETDLFTPIWQMLSDLLKATKLKNGQQEGQKESHKKAFRIICDHLRSAVFLISDGVFPANDGRGYVLKRLIRRAVRQGNKLGLKNFLEPLVLKTIETMQTAYPYLLDKKVVCLDTINKAEKQFGETIASGKKLFSEYLETQKQSSPQKVVTMIDGVQVFKLFDTFGLPLDLIQELALEFGCDLDLIGYEKEMSEQRKRARKSLEGWDVEPEKFSGYPETDFLGYKENRLETEIVDIIDNGIILKQTPFYGESGGQKGDQGIIKNEEFEFLVETTKKFSGGVIVSFGKTVRGLPVKDVKVTAMIDLDMRDKIRRNHTATHILQAVLRQVLGIHVEQSGSLVAADNLRFDFTHPKAVAKEELAEIEYKVNEVIQKNLLVNTQVMSIAEAKETGALAFFGDKYGDNVRVISVIPSEQFLQGNQPVSVEFCGGTHVNMTGEIGLFKIVFEASVASGVRRIEGVTGLTAYQRTAEMDDLMGEVKHSLKAENSNILSVIKKIKDDNKSKSKEIESLRAKLLSSNIDDIIAAAEDKGGFKFIAYNAGNIDMNAMRSLADTLKLKSLETVIFLIAGEPGSYKALCVVTKDLPNFNAKDILNKIAGHFGGGGGGRSDMAQAGIKSNKAVIDIINFAQNSW
ncbi:MAG: alanine--tRNA ligase [bacterium]|nr:alanine--tRNA ligase [bacterium]